MTKAIAQTYSLANEYRANITYGIFIACLAMVVVYAVNIYTLVHRTVSIQNTKTEIAKISSEMAKLDAKYLDISSNLNENLLAQRGLAKGHPTAYIQEVKVSKVTLSRRDI